MKFDYMIQKKLLFYFKHVWLILFHIIQRTPKEQFYRAHTHVIKSYYIFFSKEMILPREFRYSAIPDRVE